ncbi:peptidoglycan-binding protein LysM [Flavobacteriaceae sp. LMIT009]
MKRGLIASTLVPILVFVVYVTAFNSTTEPLNIDKYSIEGLDLSYNAPIKVEQTKEEETLDVPSLGKTFVGFKEALAFKESRGNYFTVNTLGYLGKYQFGKNTLKLIGIYDTSQFLYNPQLQEKAFIANTARNKWILRRDIKRFVGKTIDGVLVTESGILAAAHLAGPGSVKKYLRSYGAIGFTDAYGTNIRDYMKKFSGYDTSFIEGDRKAKATLL